MKKFIAFLAIVASPFVLYGVTKTTGVWFDKGQITNSVIDSTPIGNSSPSSGKFAWTRVSGAGSIATGTANQGLYTMWNASGSLGETRFYNQTGTGSGGFSWFNYSGTTGVNTLLMNLFPNGDLSVGGKFQGSLGGNADTATALRTAPTNCGGGLYSPGIQANGNANCLPFPQAYSYLRAANSPVPITAGGGLYLGWNARNGGGLGEGDFANYHGGGTGGFQWSEFDGTNSIATMWLDGFGNLSTAGSITSGTTIHATGDITTPANIGAAVAFLNSLTTGSVSASGNISSNSLNTNSATVNGTTTVNGTANVTTMNAGNMKHGRSGGCIAGSASYSTCTVNVDLSGGAFPDNNYDATCSGVGATNPRAYIGGITKFSNFIQVTVVNGGSDSNVGFNEVNCIAFR